MLVDWLVEKIDDAPERPASSGGPFSAPPEGLNDLG